ncbi:MAG: DNA polymerase III subunit delta [Sphaerochaeta sp.]
MTNKVYLLLGPEKGQKQEKINQIRSDLNKQFGEEIEFSKYYAFDDNNDQMYIDLNNNSLFSSHSLIVLYNIDSLKSADVDNLLRYLQHPNESSTFILDSDEFSLKSPASKIATKLKKETTIFWGLQENQLFGWIKSFFRNENLMIDDNAIQYILDQTDNDTLELKIICNQLAFYFCVNQKRDIITEDEIETFVHHSKSENAFSLFEAIAECNLRDALEIATVLLERDNTARFTLVPGLLWSFRRLTSVAQQLSMGYSPSQALSKAKVFDRANAVRSRKDQGIYSKALKNYSYKDCKRILEVLLEADIEIRSANTDIVQLYVERLIYSIIVKKGTKATELKVATFKQKL